MVLHTIHHEDPTQSMKVLLTQNGFQQDDLQTANKCQQKSPRMN